MQKKKFLVQKKSMLNHIFVRSINRIEKNRRRNALYRSTLPKKQTNAIKLNSIFALFHIQIISVASTLTIECWMKLAAWLVPMECRFKFARASYVYARFSLYLRFRLTCEPKTKLMGPRLIQVGKTSQNVSDIIWILIKNELAARSIEKERRNTRCVGRFIS